MARALVVNLPQSLTRTEVEAQILDSVKEHLRKHGIRLASVDPKLQSNILPIALGQTKKVVRKNHSIMWNITATNPTSEAYVLLDDLLTEEESAEDENEETGISEERAEQIRKDAIDAMFAALDAAASFASGAVIALSNLSK